MLFKCKKCNFEKNIRENFVSIHGYACNKCSSDFFICSSCCKCYDYNINLYNPIKIKDNLIKYVCNNCK